MLETSRFNAIQWEIPSFIYWKTHKISEIFKKSKEIVQALINIDTMNSISDKPTFYWDYQ